MFDIGAAELLVVVIVAILVIGPKDMPAALRTAGQWMAKVRRMSSHFRSGVDAMIREAELEEAEKEWNKRNADIMAKTPNPDRPDKLAEPQSLHPEEHMQATQMPAPTNHAAESADNVGADAAAEAAIARAAPKKAPEHGGSKPKGTATRKTKGKKPATSTMTKPAARKKPKTVAKPKGSKSKSVKKKA